MQKNWAIPPLGEQAKLQFRAEAFNALNTPHFGTPNNIGYVSNSSLVPDAPGVGEIQVCCYHANHLVRHEAVSRGGRAGPL